MGVWPSPSHSGVNPLLNQEGLYPPQSQPLTCWCVTTGGSGLTWLISDCPCCNKSSTMSSPASPNSSLLVWMYRGKRTRKSRLDKLTWYSIPPSPLPPPPPCRVSYPTNWWWISTQRDFFTLNLRESFNQITRCVHVKIPQSTLISVGACTCIQLATRVGSSSVPRIISARLEAPRCRRNPPTFSTSSPKLSCSSKLATCTCWLDILFTVYFRIPSIANVRILYCKDAEVSSVVCRLPVSVQARPCPSPFSTVLCMEKRSDSTAECSWISLQVCGVAVRMCEEMLEDLM